MQDPSFYSQINNAQVNQPQPQPQFPENEQLKCPRCDSTNTKFCYYNNYNLSQPRHFCKNCKRYWTKGGALRNIPVGGGTRKRTSPSAAASSAAKRPATTAVPEQESNDEKGKNGETLPLMGEKFGGQLGNLMEVSGSFSSLLGEGQFGNLVDGLGANGSGLQVGGHFADPGQGRGQDVDPQVGNGDGFLNIQGGVEGNGESGCWSGGSNNTWPDLSIYTPGSTFQ